MVDAVDILNRAGEGFYGFSLAMLVQSGVLIAALYAIDLLIRRHTRAVFRYCVWSLVFVKLVLPPALCLPTGVGYWCDFDVAPERAAVSEIADAPDVIPQYPQSAPAVKAVESPVEIQARSMPVAQAIEPLPAAAAAVVNTAVKWQAVVFLAWLVGVLVLCAVLFQRFLFVKSLLAQSERAAGDINETLRQCREQIGLPKDIELRLSMNMLSPAACGLLRPVILIPAVLPDKLTDEKLRAVFLHELAHIKRGDLWVNFIQTLLQIVYFYNPLLWFANAVVRGLREKAVDEMVLTKLGDKAGCYSSTLIDVAEIAFSKPHFSLRLVGVVESKKALTGRIKHILNRPLPKSAKLGAAGMAAILIAAAVLLPMAKAKEGVEKQDKFKKTLSNGVTIELVGVCEFPSEGKQWWRPDGAGFEPDFHTKQRGQVSSSGKPYEIAVKVDGSHDFSFTWGTAKGQTGSSMLDVFDSGNNHIDAIKAQRINIDKMGSTTTVEVGAATGQWETRFTNPGTGNCALVSGGHNIIFSNTYNVDGGIEVTVSDDFLDMDHRLILIDKTEKTHAAESRGGSTAGKVRQITYMFNDVTIENVKEYQFQTRPYEWLKFKKVSLIPDKGLSGKTAAEVSEVEMKENSRITKYRVNRTVTDFNNETDLNTPEAAYVAANRIYASGEHYRWKEISTKELAERQKDITEADNADIPPDLKKWLLDTVVLEVMVCDKYAAVIGERPLELQGVVVKERYDYREFLLEDGQWLYTGHGGGRFESIDEAEGRFAQSMKEHGINITGVDNLPQPSEYAKTSNAIIAQSEFKPDADDGKIEIGGMVVDENKNPISGASVDVLWNLFSGMGMSSVEKVQTDEQGRWSYRGPLDVNRFSVRLRHPEYYSIDFDYQPLIGNLKDKSSVLVMRKGMSLSGKVVDSRGNPVANAILMPPDSVTTISTADGLVETASTTRTKDDGTFMLKGVKNEPQKIVVDAEGFSPAIYDYDPQTNKRQDIVITLPDAAVLKGIVRDNLGNAVAGVKLKTDQLLVKKDEYNTDSGERFSWDQRINILRRQTTTNEDGSFMLTGLPPAGVFELWIIPKERNKFLLSWKHIDLAVQTEHAEYTIYPVPVIAGKVVDMHSREPVKDLSIVAGRESEGSQGIEWIPSSADKINSDDGSFEKAIRYIAISDTNCSVAVRITADGYLPYISPKVRIDQKYEPLLVELKKGDNITGVILNSDGRAAENTAVAWSSPKTKFYIQGYEFGKGFADEPESFVKTDGNGRFKFTPSDEDWTIMALDKQGYCIISKQEYKPEGGYTMTPWAVVEGNISKSLLGTDNLMISMISSKNDKFYWGVSLTPNIDGSFRYDYVPSIPLTLKMRPDKPSHLKETVIFAAGQKYNVNITEDNKWICEPQAEKLDKL